MGRPGRPRRPGGGRSGFSERAEAGGDAASVGVKACAAPAGRTYWLLAEVGRRRVWPKMMGFCILKEKQLCRSKAAMGLTNTSNCMHERSSIIQRGMPALTKSSIWNK